MKNYPFSVENYSWRNWQVPIFRESSKLSRNLKIGDRKFKLCRPDIVVRINLTGLKCQSNQLTPTTIQFDEWSWVRASRLVELWITRQNSLSRIIQALICSCFKVTCWGSVKKHPCVSCGEGKSKRNPDIWVVVCPRIIMTSLTEVICNEVSGQQKLTSKCVKTKEQRLILCYC